MSSAKRNDLVGTGHDEQALRCLKITDYTYWAGTASLAKLSALLAELGTVTNTRPATLKGDIALLARHGLPIQLAADGRCRIHAGVPGFALRLTRDEASTVWAWCVAGNRMDVAATCKVPDATIADAIAVLEAALKAFHAGSEVIAESNSAAMQSGRLHAAQPLKDLRPSDLHGEARLVYRRLRIVDLIESRRARDVSQLAAALDVSHRTIHNDLALLRQAGLEVWYRRDRHAYVMKGMNRYLFDHLTAPMAEALLTFFQVSEAAPETGIPAPALWRASRKLTRSIRLILAGQRKALEAHIPG